MNSTELFTVIKSVDSSNNHAMELIKAGSVVPGMAWMALEQMGGKGQRGKSWHSQPGQNITMSIAIKPGKIYTQNKFLLVASVANTCLQFFKEYAGENVKIKWPNDIYWKNQKVGGILIENIIKRK